MRPPPRRCRSGTLFNGEELGTFTGERASNSFLTTASSTPYLPDTVGGPAVMGKVTDSLGFEGKSQLDTFKAMLPANIYPLSLASEDSTFTGFDELFLSNLSSSPLLDVTLTINGIGTTFISMLAPGESWTTLLPDGSTQGLITISAPLGGSETLNTGGLGSNFIVDSVVPEPSTLALLGIGAVSLLAFAGRRMRQINIAKG